jgi:hypothetical protein
MNPRKVSAQFAAYAWYAETKGGAADQGEAARFAEENWEQFLPFAHEGWGRLLLRLSARRQTEGGRRRRHATTAGCGQ